jgi:hypothetical protein
MPFVARCTGSNGCVEASSPNEIVEFYRRLQRVTGTDVEWVSAEHPAVRNAPESGDVEHVLRELDGDFENGVPIGIITAAMSKQGQTVAETLSALYDLRMAGSVWEPRADHLRPV